MLHLGRNLVVSEKNIIAILGMQSGRPPVWARSFMAVRAGEPPYKSMILADGPEGCRLIFSPVSHTTLRGRVEDRHGLFLQNEPRK